jgi:LysM repeat protein
MFGGRGPLRTVAVAVAALGALVGGIWLMNALTGGPRPAAADPTGESRDTMAAPGAAPETPTSSLAAARPAPARTGGLQPQPPAIPPVVLDMGTRAEPPASTPPGAAGAKAPSSGAAATPTVAPPPTVASPPQPVPTVSPDLQTLVNAGERARQENRLVEARTILNQALLDPRASEADRAALRAMIGEINESLVFSPAVAKGDPLTDIYIVQSGDLLQKITARQGLGVDYRFLQRINRLPDANRISVGQKLKVVRGPFHAVVDKSDFRLDLYAGPPPSPSAGGAAGGDGVEPDWIFIRSYRVGLGEHGGTPTGSFVVKPRSKLIDPPWVNPRTGERFASKDPKNPIGNRWLGLDGVDEQTRPFTGYGIHGTIDPSSIGREMSMGCIRLAAADVEVIWELLQEGVSAVRIVP